ncbi:MAG: flavodoxin [Clostridium sp.]|jgi:flavodoxin short chain|uniref:flavodoxin n=1 Tax=Clostridium sp. TaxID=1506 RepID=UPI0025C73EA4|nr:flavodoxin [Clostridium sp.]MCH3963660.1 flavodoxin [Clostridium sp.]MCI1714801.1 flavodoxin [Clostridium sp.]MCI1799010.1 flavodoxin [Clostridium sp.]MCI1812984.1 flavodoxin [Clostridium sp.]MCI1869874.1 flavodoxin [Clostridium sp.]
MANINIVYWSGTGNTEKMANLISQGATESGHSVKLINVSEASEEDVNTADVLVLGSPAMGDEVIEESEMEPFVDSITDKLKGKKVALFGSYGWGDGQWMRSWQERIEDAGATLVDEGLIVNEAPEGEDETKCIEFGKSLIK